MSRFGFHKKEDFEVIRMRITGAFVDFYVLATSDFLGLLVNLGLAGQTRVDSFEFGNVAFGGVFVLSSGAFRLDHFFLVVEFLLVSVGTNQSFSECASFVFDFCELVTFSTSSDKRAKNARLRGFSEKKVAASNIREPARISWEFVEPS